MTAFGIGDFVGSDDELSLLQKGAFGMALEIGSHMTDTSHMADTSHMTEPLESKQSDEEYTVVQDMAPPKPKKTTSTKRKRKRKEISPDSSELTSAGSSMALDASSGSGVPPVKKRKRPRGWTPEEESKYLEGLEQFGRDWRKVSGHIVTRDTAAVRSHTQLHFLKLLKAGKAMPAKVVASGTGYTLSGKPLNKYSSSVLRVFNHPSAVPLVEGVISDAEEAEKFKTKKAKGSGAQKAKKPRKAKKEKPKKEKKAKKKSRKKKKQWENESSSEDEYMPFAAMQERAAPLRRSTRDRGGMSLLQMRQQLGGEDPFSLRTEMEVYGTHAPQPFAVSYCPNALLLADLHCHLYADHEVMGLLAGTYDADSKHVHVSRCVPLKEEMCSEHEVAACAVSQVEATRDILDAGLIVLGWYHAHPKFENFPSNRDLEEHHSHATVSDSPYIGLIISSWSSCGHASDFRWFNTEYEDLQYFPFEFLTSQSVTIKHDDTMLFQEMESLVERYSQSPCALRTNFNESWISTAATECIAKRAVAVSREDSSHSSTSPVRGDSAAAVSSEASSVLLKPVNRGDKILMSLRAHMCVSDCSSQPENDAAAAAVCGRIMSLFRRNQDAWWR